MLTIDHFNMPYVKHTLFSLPTVGLTQPDEELDLNYCMESYNEEVPYALSNSLGFGGHNASILLKKYEE